MHHSRRFVLAACCYARPTLLPASACSTTSPPCWPPRGWIARATATSTASWLWTGAREAPTLAPTSEFSCARGPWRVQLGGEWASPGSQTHSQQRGVFSTPTCLQLTPCKLCVLPPLQVLGGAAGADPRDAGRVQGLQCQRCHRRCPAPLCVQTAGVWGQQQRRCRRLFRRRHRQQLGCRHLAAPPVRRHAAQPSCVRACSARQLQPHFPQGESNVCPCSCETLDWMGDSRVQPCRFWRLMLHPALGSCPTTPSAVPQTHSARRQPPVHRLQQRAAPPWARRLPQLAANAARYPCT